MALSDVNGVFRAGQANPDCLLQIVASDFVFNLPAGAISEKVRDFAGHLLSVTIPSASPSGCTSHEIRDWLFKMDGAKSVAAFRESARVLHAVLVLHPGASTFLCDLIACLARAHDIRTTIRDFRRARKMLALLNMKISIGLMTELGIPEYLHFELKKNGDDPNWFPPIVLLRSPEWKASTKRACRVRTGTPTVHKTESMISKSENLTGLERVRKLFEAQMRGRAH